VRDGKPLWRRLAGPQLRAPCSRGTEARRRPPTRRSGLDEPKLPSWRKITAKDREDDLDVEDDEDHRTGRSARGSREGGSLSGRCRTRTGDFGPTRLLLRSRVADATKEPAAKSTPTTSKRKIARYLIHERRFYHGVCREAHRGSGLPGPGPPPTMWRDRKLDDPPRHPRTTGSSRSPSAPRRPGTKRLARREGRQPPALDPGAPQR